MTYWFKPHRYGIGATPANRKGWLVTIGFMLIVAAFLAALLTRDNLSVELILAWAAAFRRGGDAFHLDCLEKDGRGLAMALGFR